MPAIPSRPAAIDTKEIAVMLGVTRGYATDTIVKKPNFPQPIINVSRRIRYWDRGQVLQWMRGNTRRKREFVL